MVKLCSWRKRESLTTNFRWTRRWATSALIYGGPAEGLPLGPTPPPGPVTQVGRDGGDDGWGAFTHHLAASSRRHYDILPCKSEYSVSAVETDMDCERSWRPQQTHQEDRTTINHLVRVGEHLGIQDWCSLQHKSGGSNTCPPTQ